MNSIYYTATLLVSLFLLFILLAMVWSKRGLISAKYLIAIIIGSIIWTCSVIIENSVTALESKVFWSAAAYPGIISNPVMLFFFVLEYCNVIHYIKRKLLFTFWVVPLITILAVLTNKYHNMIWTDFTWFGDTLVYWYGPIFWLIVLYSYLLLIAGVLVIVHSFFQMRSAYKRQLIFLFVASILPFFANAMYVIKIAPFAGYDFTPIAFMFSAILLILVFKRYSFLELLPVAHHLIFSKIKAGIMILDSQNRVIEYNDNIAKQLVNADLYIGYNISNLPDCYVMIRDICLQNSFYENEVMIRSVISEYYDMSINEIFDKNRVLSGKIVMLYDITHQKSAEKQLKRSNNLLKDRLFEIERLQEKLRDQALKDPLTGLYNRRFLNDGIEKEISRAKRENSTFSIAIIELDSFKKINHYYGHSTGDKVLVTVAEVVASCIRKTDYICRFDSGILYLILTKMNPESILDKLKQIENKISDLKFPSVSDEISLVAHFGYAFYPQNGITYNELLSYSEKKVREQEKNSNNKSIIPEH